MIKLLSVRQFARLRGVSPEAVYKRIRKGDLALPLTEETEFVCRRRRKLTAEEQLRIDKSRAKTIKQNRKWLEIQRKLQAPTGKEITERDREIGRQRQNKSRNKNVEAYRQKNKKWREENKDKTKEYDRKKYLKNKN